MGGTEFIGLHLERSLVARGHEVTVFNRGQRGDRLPPGVRTIVGDRTDHAGNALASALAQTWPWYRTAGLHERPIDTSFEDGLLAKIAT